MILFGVIVVTLLSLGYDKLSHKMVLDSEMVHIEKLSKEVSQYVESQLEERVTIALTLSTAPLIKETLLKSNSDFAVLTDGERKHDIESLNQQWKKTSDINDPFIQSHLTNPIAEYFKHQQVLLPGEYGEIFLTNRYGVMIASTGKLSTLAHAHKYWWLACYDDGKGRIFLDDRGFDSSVQGYVLGVVIPIFDKNRIIGLLKCNVNIIGPLSDVVQNFGLRNSGEMKIVRTGGFIVSERDITPLSTQVDEAVVELLRTKESGSTLINLDGEDLFMAFTPVQITRGSELIGFGGSQKSIDHIKGNKGEAWYVLVSRNKEEVLAIAHKTTFTIVATGILFTLCTTAIALFLGKLVAKPIVELATTAQKIGKGHLETRTSVSSKDEIGLLGQSLNSMAQNLQDTMASRDELIYEVELRKQSEEKLNKTTCELGERLKELNCLYRISKLNDNENIITEEILQAIADIIPTAWQYPEITCAQITIGDQSYTSDGFNETEWFQSEKIIIPSVTAGEVKVFYREEKPKIDEGPFLKEERYLLNIIAKRIGAILEKKEADDEKNKLESRLKQSHKMESIGMLAGGIAHDFNNILSAVLGYTELALADVVKGAPIEEDLREVYSAGLRAKDLVNQILTFARQSDEELSPIQIDYIAKEVFKFIRSSIPTSIELKQEIKSCSLIMGDPTQIHQILMNLCTNAAHAMEQNGGILEIFLNNVTINKDSPQRKSNLQIGEYVEIKVSDTGHGIKTHVLEKIFDPYFTTKKQGEGTGMGLALVHGIVETYGGKIFVESTLGKGTVFTIYFPVCRKNKVHMLPKSERSPHGGERILFVDDEISITKIGSRALSALGYSVTTKTSSLEALDLFRSNPYNFDLVISDVTMPEMTGDKLASEILSIKPDTPIILCTGYSKTLSDEKAVELGIKSIVPKPFVKADFANTVRRVLDEDKGFTNT